MGPDGTYRWRTAGMMVQNLASEGGTPRDEDVKTVDPADWEHVLALFRTLTEAELVDPSLPAQRLLYRLFHEDGVWVYDALPLVAACRCSRDKVIGVLNTFSPPSWLAWRPTGPSRHVASSVTAPTVLRKRS